MNTDDFNENNSLDKHHIESCKINLGEFFINAPCCPDISPPSDNCCCNTKQDICFSPCDIVKKECIDVCPSCEGRLLILHVNLKNICPNKIIAVGVLIYENKKLYAFKVKKMPTGCFDGCKNKNFDAGEFCFVFPEDQLCQKRKFKVKVMSHYVEF